MRMKVPCSLSDSVGGGDKKDMTEEKRCGPLLWDQKEEVYSLEVISMVGTICGAAGEGKPETA